MKNSFRMLLIFGALVIIVVLFFPEFQDVRENPVLKSPIESHVAVPSESSNLNISEIIEERPQEGLSTYIGKNVQSFIEKFGKPTRTDPSAYGYTWLVYNDKTDYMMIGVENSKIVQVYVAGGGMNTFPFYIGQSVEEIYRAIIIETEIVVPIKDNLYTFTIVDDDLKNRLLIKLGDVYAQVYVDSEDNIVEAVRFMNAKTLVLHKPYEMMYTGEFLSPKVPSTQEQLQIDRANEMQLAEIASIYREKHGIAPLISDELLNVAAREHSKDMVVQNYFSSDSPEIGSLESRLEAKLIPFDKAGENIAENYYDAAEVVHAWLHSEDHRKTLLNDEYTHVGTGAFGKMYTQIFISKINNEEP